MKFPFSSFKLVNHSNDLQTKGCRNSVPFSLTHDMSYYKIDFGCDGALDSDEMAFYDSRESFVSSASSLRVTPQNETP